MPTNNVSLLPIPNRLRRETRRQFKPFKPFQVSIIDGSCLDAVFPFDRLTFLVTRELRPPYGTHKYTGLNGLTTLLLGVGADEIEVERTRTSQPN